MYVTAINGRPVRQTTIDALNAVGRDIFTFYPGYSYTWQGAQPEPALWLPSPEPTSKPPLKSYIDSDHGVEWVPLKAIGWPKRAIVYRGSLDEPLTDALRRKIETRVQSVSAYYKAPIFWLSNAAGLEWLRQHIADLVD